MTRRDTIELLPAAIVIAAGCVYCATLVAMVPDEVFYSGDGGLKALMVRQLLEGRLVPWLSLGEPAWVSELWDEGMYPFGPPFAHRIESERYASFEWAFPALSTPGYAIAGFRGLYALPMLAVVGTWARLALFMRSLRVGWLATSCALALFVFATPLTFYGAIFWEHTAAVALAFSGYADLASGDLDARRARAVRAGLLLGAAIWLRPEALVFGAAALAVHLSTRRWRAVALAVVAFAAMLALYFAFNHAAYGRWLGAHAIEALERSPLPGQRLETALDLARALPRRWLEHMPFTLVALALAGIAVSSRSPRARVAQRAIGVALFTLAGTAALVPNDGGLQIGPRYLLPLVPVCVLLAALGLEQARTAGRGVQAGLVVLLLGLGAVGLHANGDESERLRQHYEHRILPAVQAIERVPAADIVFTHHWAAMEMTKVIAFGRPVVTAGSAREVDRAVEAMVLHGHEVLLVDGPDERRVPFEEGTHPHGSVRVAWTVLSTRGQYDVLHGVPAAGGQ